MELVQIACNRLELHLNGPISVTQTNLRENGKWKLQGRLAVVQWITLGSYRWWKVEN